MNAWLYVLRDKIDSRTNDPTLKPQRNKKQEIRPRSRVLILSYLDTYNPYTIHSMIANTIYTLTNIQHTKDYTSLLALTSYHNSSTSYPTKVYSVIHSILRRLTYSKIWGITFTHSNFGIGQTHKSPTHPYKPHLGLHPKRESLTQT